MNNNDLTVFIIDDDPAVLDSLTLMIEQDDLSVQAFQTAKSFLEYYRPEMLGCAIIDLNMPEMDGISLQEELLARGSSLPLIFLTGHGTIPISVKAVKAGALDFLTKPVTRETLLECIKNALKECEHLLVKHEKNQQSQLLLAKLTAREQDVMRHVLEGHTNKMIAQRLGISHRTVEIHKARLMQKTGTENLLELARIVQQAG